MKQGIRATQRNALERIELLEKTIEQLVQVLQRSLTQTETRLGALAEVVDVLVGELGAEVVNKRLVETRKARVAKQADEAKAALEKAVADKQLESTDSITPDAYITGKEYDKDGIIIEPGYIQLAVQTVKPEFREKIIGQGVGFKFDTGEGGQFEITGVYRAVVSQIIAPPPGMVVQPVPEAQ